MKSIGTGLRKVSENSEQRIECQVLKIGEFRVKGDKMTYQVFWNGHTTTYQELQHIQGCLPHIREIMIKPKTKTIFKRRLAGHNYYKRFASYSQNVKYEQSPQKQYISLQSDSEKSVAQVEISSKSLLSEEGEMKSAYGGGNYNQLFTNRFDQQSGDLLREQNQQKQIGFQENQLPVENVQYEESYSQGKKNSVDQKPTIYFCKTSQNHSQLGEHLQGLSSEKSRNSNEIIFEKDKKPRSLSFAIYKQNVSQIIIKPKVENKAKQPVQEPKNDKKLNVKLNKGTVNITIPPLKRQLVFVTKRIREGRNVTFEIMVYNEDGILIPKMISHHELLLKAPYALIKFYECRIIS